MTRREKLDIQFYVAELDDALGRAVGKQVAARMALEAEDYETQTELAECMANDFDLYVGDDIPEAVFELASILKPGED